MKTGKSFGQQLREESSKNSSKVKMNLIQNIYMYYLMWKFKNELIKATRIGVRKLESSYEFSFGFPFEGDSDGELMKRYLIDWFSDNEIKYTKVSKWGADITVGGISW